MPDFSLAVKSLWSKAEASAPAVPVRFHTDPRDVQAAAEAVADMMSVHFGLEVDSIETTSPTSSVDSVIVEPKPCQTSFRFVDQHGDPLASATVRARIIPPFYLRAGGAVNSGAISATTDSDGRLAIKFIQSSQFSTGGEYEIEVKTGFQIQKYSYTAPNTSIDESGQLNQL